VIAHRGALLPLAAALACGGHASPPLSPVPVEGPAREVRALAGHWQGRFENTVAGRTGTIIFLLDPDQRTAQGSVSFPGPAAAGRTGLTVVRIGRLVVDQGSVAGWLESYRDAERNCLLETWFEGTRQADTIRGAFFAHPSVGDTIQMGRWWAARAR